MGEALKLETITYNYGELKQFPEGEKWEIINGVPHMQAQPTIEHQEIAAEIITQIRTYLRGKPCRVIPEPAVWLKEMADATKDYVIPDIAVVCDSNKIITEGIVGAPDLVIEIVSPSTEEWDRHDKLRKYRSSGVREYWIVDPKGFVSVHRLNGGVYEIDSFRNGKVPVAIFEELAIDFDLVFNRQGEVEINTLKEE
ncbi:MAG: Uma2 family endonuclease [Bacillota bacterium]|jgi:Uma2 family endonuclease